MKIHFLVTIAVTYKQYFQKIIFFKIISQKNKELPPYKHSATAP